MRHMKGHRKLGRQHSHRKLMLAGQVKALIEHGKVDTTEARAKESRRLADKCVTWAKKGDMAAQREAFKLLQDKDVVARLFDEIGPKFEDRQGGYTRVLKLPPRRGDGSQMARLTWVE